jgi:hypothetical protein
MSIFLCQKMVMLKGGCKVWLKGHPPLSHSSFHKRDSDNDHSYSRSGFLVSFVISLWTSAHMWPWSVSVSWQNGQVRVAPAVNAVIE